MAPKLIKRTIIIGAGFSAPAKLPIQNRIIDKMTEEPALDFLFGNMPTESIKFLHAYITVGLFLLDSYGKNDFTDLEQEYSEIRQLENIIQLSSNAKYLHMNSLIEKQATEPFRSFPPSDDVYRDIYSLRERIRRAIKAEGISVNLEDIFTSFDKSFLASEHHHKYSYFQMDTIRYSIIRLFSYYFSKGVLDNTFDKQDYINFIRYIKARRSKTPTTIITTNWDTLLEGYLNRAAMKYYYGFQYPYTSPNELERSNDKHLFLKIHGSANWLRCLNCGSISVHENNNAASSLFEDGKYESCISCGTISNVGKPSLQPEIITPTMIKSLSNQLYSNLWNAAASEIRDATHIIFVGYSLPIADFDFRYLLQKNVSSSAAIDVVLYEDANPRQTESEVLKSLLPEKRYRDAFPKNRINFHYEGFGDFFARH